MNYFASVIMEKQLNYVFMLSLEEMALRRLAVALWNADILASIGKLQLNPNDDPVWIQEWHETFEDKMSKLQLPASLSKKIIPILKAVGSEIPKWKLFHETYLSFSNEEFSVHVLEKLCWTTAGTVDYRKTADEIVRSDVVNIAKRFQLACFYCLENYIPLFWKELHEYEEDTSPDEMPHLQLFLPYILRREEYNLGYSPLTSFPRNSFEYSAFYENKTAAEYRFWRLTEEEREASLVQIAENVIRYRNDTYPFDVRRGKLSDVLSYLLSLMTPEKQIQIFKELPCEVLRCFLDWPWQDLFLDIADVIWTFLPESKYDMLLLKISESIRSSGYYFPNLIQNLFLRSPIDFRKHFVDFECRKSCFFPEFFYCEDVETIKVIFRNVDAAERVRLVTSKYAFQLFCNFILRGKWNLVEVCLREATLSKEDKERLEEGFMRFLRRIDRGQLEWGTPKWGGLFAFLYESDASAQSKRRSDDETLPEAKKLCCEKEENSTKYLRENC
ncbi:hypothetical protein AVEN_95010-1 [Araneus ventricosus]|uniref:Uncharacterized protein n=1 Tax=Araneus ventricosus TaxID=182803 RepID=A0A4Y2RAA7_ARAVE|nr:hypothetical protein AVEN_95010-1 [Araneus ventricosus]